MDYPILKQLDVLIGLAVVMLIASTVVAALTQAFLNSSYSRSRYVRAGLEEMVRQLSSQISADDARRIVNGLMLNGLVARRDTRFMQWLTKLPFLKWLRGNQADVMQREELVMCLLDWASNPHWAGWSEAGEDLSQIRAKLRAVLAENGLPNPESAAQAVRALMLRYEKAAPQVASQLWRSQAVIDGAASDFTGKIFAWYDNTMVRARENFSLEAKVVASVVALVFAFAVQLDSVDLLRRLSQDEKFREALAAKAKAATKLYEESQGKKEEAKQEMDKALDILRDPKASAIPSYFAWDQVAQLQITMADLTDVKGLQLRFGEAVYKLTLSTPASLAGFREEVMRNGVPVNVYRESEAAVRLVARDASLPRFQLFRGEKALRASCTTWDWVGLRARCSGVVLSWILLSLGAPFWYDLLKKLMGLRSLLVAKNNQEQDSRQADLSAKEDTNALRAASQQATGGGFDLTVQGGPEAVVLVNDTKLYIGAPSRDSGTSRVIPAGCLMNVVGWVKGQPVANASGTNIDKWYKTVDGEFFWAGDTQQ